MFVARALVSAVALEVSLPPGVLIGAAEARFGRPLTPAILAGAARRTSRRTVRRTTAYVTTLPVGCTTVIVEGASLHQCGANDYQAQGNQYVIVNID